MKVQPNGIRLEEAEKVLISFGYRSHSFLVGHCAPRPPARKYLFHHVASIPPCTLYLKRVLLDKQTFNCFFNTFRRPVFIQFLVYGFTKLTYQKWIAVGVFVYFFAYFSYVHTGFMIIFVVYQHSAYFIGMKAHVYFKISGNIPRTIIANSFLARVPVPPRFLHYFALAKLALS